jgi:hypothetical protein
MGNNKHLDRTLERNFLRDRGKLVVEYEQIKQGKHMTFKFVQQFYNYHQMSRQNFIKYYNRYRLEGEGGLMPRKRGRRFGDIKIIPEIEAKIVELRLQGHGRYDVHNLLSSRFGVDLPSYSTIYNVFLRHGINKVDDKLIQAKQRYIRETVGELMHVDCYSMPKGIVDESKDKYHLVGMIDDNSRYVMLSITKDVKSLSVTNSLTRMIGAFEHLCERKVQELLTDNGSEFGGVTSKNLDNPFLNLMSVLGIKHRKTKPYRPQTNGKIERFWKTLNLEFLEGRTFSTLAKLQAELIEYQIYYNYLRPHQGINGYKPIDYVNLSPI